jgi:hypothetical protein
MADLMERMDARDGRLGRRSSCGSPPSFLISVEVIGLKGAGVPVAHPTLPCSPDGEQGSC